MNTDIKFIQVNLYHAKGATGILYRRFLKENFSVAFIQEPWVNKNRVLGIAGQIGKLVYDEGHLSILKNFQIKPLVVMNEEWMKTKTLT